MCEGVCVIHLVTYECCWESKPEIRNMLFQCVISQILLLYNFISSIDKINNCFIKQIRVIHLWHSRQVRPNGNAEVNLNQPYTHWLFCPSPSKRDADPGETAGAAPAGPSGSGAPHGGSGRPALEAALRETSEGHQASLLGIHCLFVAMRFINISHPFQSCQHRGRWRQLLTEGPGRPRMPVT